MIEHITDDQLRALFVLAAACGAFSLVWKIARFLFGRGRKR